MTGKNATQVLAADAQGIAAAGQILLGGGLVAVPTETVYGLAARADDAAAVARIYAAKARPDFNPLIVHVGSTDQAKALAHWCELASLLANEFWPGPLTMVLPARMDAGLADAVTAGLPTIALRQPAHRVMQALLDQIPCPLAAPSANRSGGVSPTTADHVRASLEGRIDAVIDGRESSRGLESTIVALRRDGTWQLLRPGPIAEHELTELLGAPTAVSSAIEAPGQLASHYSPGKPVRLEAAASEPDEFMIGFGAVPGDCSLSPSGNLVEAAARLYACLHQAARAPQPRVAIAAVPCEGLGAAINDRLRRAAV